MGIWNSHTSVGNILGSLLAGVWVDQQWGFSFVVPGIITAIMGIITFFFLIECEWTPLPASPQGRSGASQLGSGRWRLVPWGARDWRPRRVTQDGRFLTRDACLPGLWRVSVSCVSGCPANPGSSEPETWVMLAAFFLAP